MVGHYRRRNAGNREFKQLIEQGAIGKPVLAEGNVSNFLGMELTPEMFRWRGDDTGCPAGALMTMGIHLVDVFNYFFGPIESVSAYFSKIHIPADVEDVTISMCRFKSGMLGYIGTQLRFAKSLMDVSLRNRRQPPLDSHLPGFAQRSLLQGGSRYGQVHTADLLRKRKGSKRHPFDSRRSVQRRN